MANRTLAVKVTTDVQGTDKIRGLGGTLAGAGVQLAKFGALAGGAFAAVGAFSANFASDLNESMSKVNVVFGDSADEIIAWSDTAASAMGISQQQALESAGTFGNLFSAMGIGQDASQDMSTELVQLASDLASFNNIEPTEALEKLRAGIVGEAEPLRTLGVNISAARTEMKAMELGLISAGEELTAADKAAANYAIIMEDTALAQGDFARTSDGMANQQRTLAATFQDTVADIGQAFVPLIEAILPAVTSALQAFGSWVTDNTPAIQGTIQTVLGAIGAAFSFLVDNIIPAVAAGFTFIGENILPGVLAAFDWLGRNILPAIIGAFQAIFDWTAENWPTISSVIGQAFGAIRNVVEAVSPILGAIATVAFPAIGAAASVLFGALDLAFKGIGGAVEIMGNVIGVVVDGVRDAWNGLVGFFRGIVRAFGGIGDRIFAPLGEGFDAVVGGIKGVWNAFARWWNSIELSVPRIDIPFVGPVGGFTVGLPDLPTFAEGGIVTKPTLGLFGEAGPEAVVPLDRLQGSTVNVYVTVHGDLRADDEDSLADSIRRSLWVAGTGSLGFGRG